MIFQGPAPPGAGMPRGPGGPPGGPGGPGSPLPGPGGPTPHGGFVPGPQYSRMPGAFLLRSRVITKLMSKEEEGEWVLMEVLEDQGVLSKAACQGLWPIWSAQPATLGEAWGRWALEGGWA